jgi:hypothetical protein
MQNILFFLDTCTESPLSSRSLLKKRHLCRLVKNAQMQGDWKVKGDRKDHLPALAFHL